MAEIDKEALFNELQMRIYALQNDFKRLDTESEALVTHWRFADRFAFELRVEFYRRFNTRPGILEDNEGLMPPGYYAYGYDAQERIVCAANFRFLDGEL